MNATYKLNIGLDNSDGYLVLMFVSFKKLILISHYILYVVFLILCIV